MTGPEDSFLTLGIESSCDDSAVALLQGRRSVIAELMASQTESHAPFGGVVPEFAARQHLEAFLPLMEEVLRRGGLSDPAKEIGLIAVTAGPGLMGSLLVGVMAAKALAMAWDVPLIGINHLEGHMFANIVSFPDVEPHARRRTGSQPAVAGPGPGVPSAESAPPHPGRRLCHLARPAIAGGAGVVPRG